MRTVWHKDAYATLSQRGDPQPSRVMGNLLHDRGQRRVIRTPKEDPGAILWALGWNVVRGIVGVLTSGGT